MFNNALQVWHQTVASAAQQLPRELLAAATRLCSCTVAGMYMQLPCTPAALIQANGLHETPHSDIGVRCVTHCYKYTGCMPYNSNPWANNATLAQSSYMDVPPVGQLHHSQKARNRTHGCEQSSKMLHTEHGILPHAVMMHPHGSHNKWCWLFKQVTLTICNIAMA